MRITNTIRVLAAIGVLLLSAACGGSDDRVSLAGPGFVGIDDRPDVSATAPLLIVEYTEPGVTGPVVASIFSDQPTDGDIAFDPILGSFVITRGPDTLLFGIDSFSRNRIEYRAFLDFPLDGSTAGPVIPLAATIEAAELSVFVDFVDFAAVVPVFLDLVTYDVVGGLVPADYSSTPLDFIPLEFFGSDTGQFVTIDVTTLMREAQRLELPDFQVRFLVGP